MFVGLIVFIEFVVFLGFVVLTNVAIHSDDSLALPSAVIARSGATWQSRCTNRDCFALLAMTESECIEKLFRSLNPSIPVWLAIRKCIM